MTEAQSVCPPAHMPFVAPKNSREAPAPYSTDRRWRVKAGKVTLVEIRSRIPRIGLRAYVSPIFVPSRRRRSQDSKASAGKADHRECNSLRRLQPFWPALIRKRAGVANGRSAA